MLTDCLPIHNSNNRFTLFQKFVFVSFQSDVVYPNGARMPVKMSRKLEVLEGGIQADRNFINATFDTFFGSDYLKQLKIDLTREDALKKLRSSNEHDIMHGK